MGGRGSSFGGGGGGTLSKASPEQKKIMTNILNVTEKNGYSKPVFKPQSDGFIYFEYLVEKHTVHVHGGKMQSPEKDDVYLTTETHRGRIGRDGLIIREKTTHSDKLVKRGKRR